MKTKPMAHQTIGCGLLEQNPQFFALGAEQGTGKTWMLLSDIERQWEAGLIDGALVIAPKGVHANWILREAPAHLSVTWVGEFWLAGMGKKAQAKLHRLFSTEEREVLPILAMNVDAVNTNDGFALASRFLTRFRSMIIVDESHKIKNHDAKRTKRLTVLGKKAVSRRIASGTLVANSPLDLFGQYEFLEKGLLSTSSFRSFTAEFATLLPSWHPKVQEATRRARKGTPQIVATDTSGRPIFKNLDKLSELMRPFTYRVRKDECLDLPPKIYQTQFFELSPKQRKLYDQIKQDLRWQRDDGEIDIFTALTLVTKLRQVTSGFMMIDGVAKDLVEAKPRLDAMHESLEIASGQVIIWASFREEISQIVASLKGKSVVQYHGGTKDAERIAAIDTFQSGGAEYFVATPGAGSEGLTLTAAEGAIYYSCSYSLLERSQSEDRCHRIGTKRSVTYTDLVARDTIDERIAAALQSKAEVSATILDGL